MAATAARFCGVVFHGGDTLPGSAPQDVWSVLTAQDKRLVLHLADAVGPRSCTKKWGH